MPALMDTLVEVLPKEKKYSFVREAKEEVKSEEVKEKAEKGVWDAVKDFVGEAWDSVKNVAAEVLATTALGLMKKLWEKRGKFF